MDRKMRKNTEAGKVKIDKYAEKKEERGKEQVN